MFMGFLGTGEGNLDVESNGIVSGSTRVFYMSINTKRVFNNATRTFFDYDNVNVIKANQEVLGLGGGLITYTGKPKTLLGQYFPGPQSTSMAGGIIPVYLKFGNADNRGFLYSSNSVLSPVTRKVRNEINFYETRNVFIWNAGLAGTIATSASNAVVGNLEINSDKYPYVESVMISGGFLTNLNLRIDKPTLKYFVLRETAISGTLTGSLPSSLLTFAMHVVTGITSVSSLLANCVNLQSFFIGITVNNGPGTSYSNPLTGTLDISHMTVLKELNISPISITSLILPTGKTDWSWYFITLMNTTVSAAFSTTSIDDALNSPNLIVFTFSQNAKTLTKNIGNSEIASTLLSFFIIQNSWSGTISITTAKPNVKNFYTGINATRTGTQLNSFPTVNITGLTACVTIDLSGSDIADLTLPVNTVCSTLVLMGNKLDIVTNTNLVAQINAMTALTTLQLSGVTASTAGTTPSNGQNSTNGLGANPVLSGLLNCSIIDASDCKMTGTLTVYNGAKLIRLLVAWNTGLTTITNLSAHATTITTLGAHGCSALTLNITSAYTKLQTININNTILTGLDLSAKSTTGSILLVATNCTGASITVTFPSNTLNAVCNPSFQMQNSNVATLVNVSNLSHLGVTGAAVNTFYFNGNALNMTFPFGDNNFYPNQILIQDNGMSQANVDATLLKMFTNATQWNTYSSAKTLNIAGTNAAPSGIYQFSATPSTGNEYKYYLVNTKGWTITSN